MTDPETARHRRRPSVRLGAAAAALALVAPLAACGADDGGGGAPTLNLYYPPEQNLQKVVDDCNAQAAGAVPRSPTGCCPGRPTTSGCRWCAGWPPRTAGWTCSAWT